MPTSRQQQFLPQLISILGAISQIEPLSLVRREQLGTDLCFESGEKLFADVIGAAIQVQRVDLERIPYPHLNQLLNSFSPIYQVLDQIRNFSPVQHGNPGQGRDGLLTALEDHWGNAYQAYANAIGTKVDDSLIRTELEGLSSQIKTAMQLSSDVVASINTKKVELESSVSSFLDTKASEFEKAGAEKLSLVTAALDEVRKAAAEAGVSQTSKHFIEEASEHLTTSRWWLGAVVTLAISLLAFSLFGTHIMDAVGVQEPDLSARDFIIAKYLAQKGLVVFCLTFGLIWSVKNYGAARHNYVVNKHRSNALGSFQAFATSATDEQTKSAVLIQATQSIFSPQPSGYVKTDGDNSPSGPVIEILRSVGVGKEK